MKTAKPKLAVFDEDQLAELLRLESKLSSWKQCLEDLLERCEEDGEKFSSVRPYLDLLHESVSSSDHAIGEAFDELENRIDAAKAQLEVTA
jgi:septation ring formation regulator EzrA